MPQWEGTLGLGHGPLELKRFQARMGGIGIELAEDVYRRISGGLGPVYRPKAGEP